MSTNDKVAAIITDRIITKLEAGVVPWRKPWKSTSPRNVSGRPYKGINRLLLGMTDYDSPFYATFKEVQERGWRVQKGQHAEIVVLYQPIRKTEHKPDDPKANADGDVTKSFWLVRYYKVFNVSQLEAGDKPIPERFLAPDKVADHEAIAFAEDIVTCYPDAPTIVQKGDSASYAPRTDKVTVPKMEKFDSPESFYATLFHELVHSSGAAKRLNRPGITAHNPFGSEGYAKEELVAEMGAAFLCAEAAIEPLYENTTAYIQSWLKALKNDKNLVLVAASQAQKAIDHILDETEDKKEEDAA